MADRLRTPDGRFANREQIDAFNRALEEGASEAEAMAKTFGDAKKASDSATRSKEKETKATKGFVDSLRSAVGAGPLGVVANAARAGVFTSNTTTATFGQGFQNSIEGLYSNSTGAGLTQRNAIAQGGQDTFSFFAEAAANGAEISDATLRQYQDYFETRRRRQGALLERTEGNVVQRQNDAAVGDRAKVIEDFIGQIQQDIREILNRIPGGGGK